MKVLVADELSADGVALLKKSQGLTVDVKVGLKPPELKAIIGRLESEGLRVGEPLSGRDIGVIRSVIVAGHRLSAKLRRRPTVDEIAVACGHPPFVVRRALEHGRAAAPLRALRH